MKIHILRKVQLGEKIDKQKGIKILTSRKNFMRIFLEQVRQNYKKSALSLKGKKENSAAAEFVILMRHDVLSIVPPRWSKPAIRLNSSHVFRSTLLTPLLNLTYACWLD